MTREQADALKPGDVVYSSGELVKGTPARYEVTEERTLRPLLEGQSASPYRGIAELHLTASAALCEHYEPRGSYSGT